MAAKQKLELTLMGRLFSYEGYEKNRERDLWELVVKKSVPVDLIVDSFRSNKIGGEGFAEALSDVDVMERFEAHKAAKAAKAGKKVGKTTDASPAKAHVDPNIASPALTPVRSTQQPATAPSSTGKTIAPSSIEEGRAIRAAEEEIKRMEEAERKTQLRRENERLAEEQRATRAKAMQEEMAKVQAAAEKGKLQKKEKVQQEAQVKAESAFREQEDAELKQRVENEKRRKAAAASALQAAGFTGQVTPSTEVGVTETAASAMTGKVQAFVALAGTESHKMLVFPRNATMVELLDLAEKKYTFPVRLFMMEDNERIELDDDDSLDAFLESCPPGTRGKMVAERTQLPPASPTQRNAVSTVSSSHSSNTTDAGEDVAVGKEPPVRKPDSQPAKPPLSRPNPTTPSGNTGAGVAVSTTTLPSKRPSTVPVAPRKLPARPVATHRVRPTVFEQASPIYCVALSPSGKQIATACRDQTLQLWQTDNNTGSITLTDGGRNSAISHKAPVLCCEFDPTETELISGAEDGEIKTWILKTGKVKYVLKGHKEKVFMVHYNNQGRGSEGEGRAAGGAPQYMCSCSADATIRVWFNGRCQHILKDHTDPVYCCNFGNTANGKLLASSSGDRNIKLWDWQAETVVRTLKGHTDAVWCVRFNSDDSKLVSSATDGEVICWSAINAAPLFALKAHLEPIHDVMFSHNDQFIISCSRDWSIKIHEARKGGKKIETLTGHRHAVFHMDLLKDKLVSCSFDNSVRLWQLPALLWHQGDEEDVGTEVTSHGESRVEANEM